MEAKGCAKPAVWTEARRFFYWSLRARLARSAALSKIADANPELSYDERVALFESQLPAEQPDTVRGKAELLESLDISARLTQVRGDYLAQRFVGLALADRSAVYEGLERLRGRLSAEEKSALIAALSGEPSAILSQGKLLRHGVVDCVD
jgi:acetyl-CoA carboxylase/biotin carboxylase 1